MTNVLINKESLENIADAIRSKDGQTAKYKPAQMADAIAAISGGGGITPTGTKTINVNSNGTITEDVTNYASAQVNVNVPNPSTGTKQITTNGDHDVTDYATAHVAVPQPSGSTSITQNGTHSVADYAEAVVNVPNSYLSSDEGKVVSNGALVAQTSKQITQNGTVDTTLNNEVVVNVPTGITPSGSQTFTENGTYDVTSLAEAVVNVASGGSTPIRGIDRVEFVANNPDVETVVINMPDLTNFVIDSVSSNSSSYLKTVDITTEKAITFNNQSSSSQRVRIETLELHGALLHLSGNYALRYMDKLKTVNAFISNVLPSTLNNQFYMDNLLETIFFVENVQTNSIKLESPVLSQESLISLANGLNEAVTDKTLTVHNTQVTMCGQITGNSVEVTADETTYHRFVADPNGSMTLTDFITTVKGWTLA